MRHEITVKRREVYGSELIYPVCATAIAFAAIAGTKTLTAGVLRLIISMGYIVKYEL